MLDAVVPVACTRVTRSGAKPAATSAKFATMPPAIVTRRFPADPMYRDLVALVRSTVSDGVTASVMEIVSDRPVLYVWNASIAGMVCSFGWGGCAYAAAPRELLTVMRSWYVRVPPPVSSGATV